MALEFDNLESNAELRRRALRNQYLRDLQESDVRAAPPPSLAMPIRQAPYVGPTKPDKTLPSIEKEMQDLLERGQRNEQNYLPPSPLERVAQAGAGNATDQSPVRKLPSGLPPGYSAIPEGLPPGYSVEGEGSKAGRFLQNVTPQGPISGLISLIRTAGQAAQGQRPDLLTNPENAIPEAVQGAVVGPGARALARPIEPQAAGMVRAVPMRPTEPPVSPVPTGPLRLTGPNPETTTPAQLWAAEIAQNAAQRARYGVQDYGPPPIKPAEPGPITAEAPPPQPLLEAPGPARPAQVIEGQLPAGLRPHLDTLNTIVARSPETGQALRAAIPEDILTQALSIPGKAASIAAWARAYERGLRSNFTSPQSRGALGLATRNLRNNLKDLIGGE